ncbi:PadR family transcriptional regulator [Nonomuraea dietziae]|uniref:PadR family transcriptional regulator n=1 Tax=Nonomuraea dietziae TaxID=65515 RepID=UPI00340D8A1C
MEIEVRVTPKKAQLLKIFLEAPDQPRYGFELMQLTGQPSGTAYPILAELERGGWITSSQEDIDPSKAGRPRRRVYVLTCEGYLAARQALEDLSETFRPPAPVQPRGRR